MDLETLLLHPPSLHVNRSGNAVPLGAGGRLLRYMDQKLHEGDVTLETGAGLSTLVFAMKKCLHTAVVPDQDQVDRILAWCAAHDVQTDTLTFAVEPSEKVLPGLDPAPLDLVLIDGGHGFPIPMLDWFYAGRRLREGGTLIVDDVQIWTGRVLLDVLAKEPQWRIDHKSDLEFFAATRTGTGPAGEWTDQPYVLHQSYASGSTSLLRRARWAVSTGTQFAGRATALARRGEWTELRRRAEATLRAKPE